MQSHPAWKRSNEHGKRHSHGTGGAADRRDPQAASRKARCCGSASKAAAAPGSSTSSTWSATQAEDDILIQRDGAAVLIDSVSLNYLAGSEIDFVDDLIGASFRINNPQAKASCGCGTSFSL